MDARTNRRLVTAVTAAKVLVVLVLVFAVANPTWSRFEDKGMAIRLLLYPLMLAVVPVAWYLVARARPAVARPEYPAVTDLLVTLPFVIDVLGNAFDLYDSIAVFDDVCHFVNWALLTGGVGALLLRARALPPWACAGLCVAFGAGTAIVWEIAEYGAFVANSSEFLTAYRDTIGDLTLGLSGTVLAAAVTWAVARRRTPASRITNVVNA